MTPRSPVPTTGAGAQVARLLRLVPLLHARDGLRVDEAASALGVTAEQVTGDLKVLFMCGLPGGLPDDLIDLDLDVLEGEGDGVIRISNADYLARPLRLTPTEATALIVALRAVRSTSDPATRDVVDRALAKLETAAAEGSAAAQVDLGEGTDALAEVRTRLADAVARGRQVRLTYWVPSRDEEAARIVDPRGIVAVRGMDYLDAWCHRAEAPRTFRLDRIHDLRVLDSGVAEHEEPPRGASSLFDLAESGTLVTLLLDPPASWVPEYYAVRDRRDVGDGRTEVDLLVADEAWLERFLLRLAPHVRVLAPAEFASSFSDVARRALGLYTSAAYDETDNPREEDDS